MPRVAKPDTTKPKKKTYRFFEPKNDAFFIAIAGAYSEYYSKNIEEIVAVIDQLYCSTPFTKKDGKILRNYKKNLPFRGCDLITDIHCDAKNRKCGNGEKCAVITSHQSKLLAKPVKDAIKELEALQTTNKRIIINKIKCNFSWLSVLATEEYPMDEYSVEEYPADEEKSNFFDRYAKRIDSIWRNKKPEALVFACAKNDSNYELICDKIVGVPLKDCHEYQKLQSTKPLQSPSGGITTGLE